MTTKKAVATLVPHSDLISIDGCPEMVAQVFAYGNGWVQVITERGVAFDALAYAQVEVLL